MDLLSQFFHYILSFVIVISVVVTVHEFGHYLVARLCGVKITDFSIGFGKELFGWTSKSGTRWKVAALPLGGYVKMFGDASAASNADEEAIEHLPPEQRKYTFHFQPLPAKAAIVIAGPLANFLLTIAIFTGFILTVGLPSIDPVVGSVMPDTPAAEAGLQAGDRITAINGDKVSRFGDITYLIATNTGTPVKIVFLRNGTEQTVTLTPREFQDTDALGHPVKRPLVGIRSQEIHYEKADIFKAMAEATRRTYQLCAATLVVLKQMIMGERSASELKGPVGIAQLSGAATEKGISTTIWLIAVLSANLGFINLLPIPVLDGGHLLYYAAEAARGRPLAQKLQDYGYKLGLSLIVLLMAFTLFNDLRQWIF